MGYTVAAEATSPRTAKKWAVGSALVVASGLACFIAAGPNSRFAAVAAKEQQQQRVEELNTPQRMATYMGHDLDFEEDEPAHLSDWDKSDGWSGRPDPYHAFDRTHPMFPQPENRNLLIDMNPDKDPDLWRGADFSGVGCHKFSYNDQAAMPHIGETNIPVEKNTVATVTDAFPGGIFKRMMLFQNKYCDYPRGRFGDKHGRNGGACYRSEWTLANICRKDNIPLQGELWFGFALFIPQKVGLGMAADKKFLLPQNPEMTKLMNTKFTDGVPGKPKGWDPPVFATEQRNWLDLFQIHHGGWGGHGKASQAKGVQGREPLIALTLMDGKYYTMMLSGSNAQKERVTTIDRIADANLGEWEYFVYHTVMSSSPSKGRAELWRNGEKIVDRKNLATQYDTDNNLPYPKFGAYADTWKYHRHEYTNKDLEVGFGRFTMGGAGASYADVCISRCGPGGQPKPGLVAPPAPHFDAPAVVPAQPVSHQEGGKHQHRHAQRQMADVAKRAAPVAVEAPPAAEAAAPVAVAVSPEEPPLATPTPIAAL